MPEVKVRDATETDINAIVDIYRDCFPVSGLSRLGRHACGRHFEAVLTRGSYRLLVAQDGGEIVAFAVLVRGKEGIITRAWYLRSGRVWLEAIRLAVRHPVLAAGHVVKALRLGAAGRRSRTGGPRPEAERFRGLSTVWLENLAVSRAQQGRGTGSEFLSKLFEISRGMGFDCMKLNVDANNQKAIRVYEKTGFARTAESPHQFTYARLLGARKG